MKPCTKEVLFFGATISFQVCRPEESVTCIIPKNGSKPSFGFVPKAKMSVKGVRASQEINK